MNVTIRVCAVLITVSCVACTTSEDVDERMLKAYTEYVVLRMSSSDTVVVKKRLDSLIQAHGYTEESFFAELSSYSKNRETMRMFYDSVRVRIGRMQAESSR